MNSFQTCRNTSDAVPLYLPQQLFLKPAARLTISMQLPNMNKLEQSVSHWEIMEKLRTMIRPDEFSILTVVKTTIEIIRFEAELDNKTRLDKVISKLDNQTIKLKNIPHLIRLKSAEKRSDFPTRRDWDNFFQEAKDMNELKPGERPDTVHLSNLPTKWFVPYFLVDDDDKLPSEKLFFRIFEKFGSIRYVDIPMCDPYRKKMKTYISGIKCHTFDDKEFFEGYIQFKDYIGFTNTMSALKGMKLMKKENDEAICVNIKVDFDRSKHLSDASIRRREIVRDRLVRKQKEKEEKEQQEVDQKVEKEKKDRQNEIELKIEKEQRRKEREEKRKRKILEKLKINTCGEINDKIAKEEKKLLKVQRKLEAIRLVEELFRRIKDKKHELTLNSTLQHNSNDELKRLKSKSELEVLSQRQKLNSAIEGRIVLKSILSGKKQPKSETSSNSDSSSPSHSKDVRDDALHPAELLHEPPNWYGYPYPVPSAILYPAMRGNYQSFKSRGHIPGASRGRPFVRGRGFNRRYRGGYNNSMHYPPEIEQEYVKYFSKFFPEHDSRHLKRSRSRPRTRSRHRSYSHSRTRRRSYSHSSSRSRSRSRSHSSRRRNRRSRSRSKSRSRSRSTTPRKRSRSKSRFTPPSSDRKRRDKSNDSKSSHDNRSKRSKSLSLPRKK